MKEEKNQLLLHHHLKKLKLPTILREWPAVAAACSRDRLDYAAFLLHLVERELIEREQRAAQRRIKNARFPVLKTLESFAFEAQPSINEALIRELMRGEYVDQRENVLLLGNAGTGKTHLVTALVTHMLEQRDNHDLQRFMKQLERLDLLILDELGYVPFSKTGSELLFDVVSRAYERTSLIVTTNLPFENWIEVLGSERLTGALLDRLTHRVHILEANGQSYRLRDARRRRRGTKQ